MFTLPERHQLSESDKENVDDNIKSDILEETDQTKDVDFVDLDDETLEILGEGIDQDDGELTLHPKLVETWKKVLLEGLDKETKVTLLKTYPRKGNCPIETPKLNPEVEASVSDTMKRRDKYLAIDQDLCGAGLSSLGKAINAILNDSKVEIDRRELLKALIDSGRLLCDLFRQLTKARKALIYPALEKKARTLLENSETDEFLFGSGLSDRVKTAKSVEKVGLTLKPQVTTKKTPYRPQFGLNWRSPSVRLPSYPQAGYYRKSAPRKYQPNRAHEKNRPTGRTQSQNRQPTPQTVTSATQH